MHYAQNGGLDQKMLDRTDEIVYTGGVVKSKFLPYIS